MSFTQKKGIAILVAVCMLVAQLVAPSFAQSQPAGGETPGLKLYISTQGSTSHSKIYNGSNQTTLNDLNLILAKMTRWLKIGTERILSFIKKEILRRILTLI